MGRLAELRAEQAALTKENDDIKRSIHENYMRDLANLRDKTHRARARLNAEHRTLFNRALSLIEQEKE